ncbi:MAG: anhydro-N-acetylmuramic acid kinase [Rhodospirillaceae bacterium]|nr:anhydro-N-acetylmuramic acid kinase [Rhodospirillaceae bacterium]
MFIGKRSNFILHMSNNSKIFTSIGLMSGTSLDGVDAAIIKTDGKNFIELGPAITLEYSKNFRSSLFSVINSKNKNKQEVSDIEFELTKYHADIIKSLLKLNKLSSKNIDIIGFHGQTILHNPEEKISLQIGDPIQLANELKINVVNDMRSADIIAGGEGAPLVPIYHYQCFKNFNLPLAILNIGGVSNITWIGLNDLVAFDSGPGNSLINDWVKNTLNLEYDDLGSIANRGKPYSDLVNEVLSNNFFKKTPPKSLDRNYFNYRLIPKTLTPADGAATAVDIIVKSIKISEKYMPVLPKMLLVCGGGRKNELIMSKLSSSLSYPVKNIDETGFRGDFIEAEAFAYLAVRKIKNLPTSFPKTTGCRIPTCGGKITYYK